MYVTEEPRFESSTPTYLLVQKGSGGVNCVVQGTEGTVPAPPIVPPRRVFVPNFGTPRLSPPGPKCRVEEMSLDSFKNSERPEVKEYLSTFVLVKGPTVFRPTSGVDP